MRLYFSPIYLKKTKNLFLLADRNKRQTEIICVGEKFFSHGLLGALFSIVLFNLQIKILKMINKEGRDDLHFGSIEL